METSQDVPVPTSRQARRISSRFECLGIHGKPATTDCRPNQSQVLVDQGSFCCSCKKGRRLQQMKRPFTLLGSPDDSYPLPTRSPVRLEDHREPEETGALSKLFYV